MAQFHSLSRPRDDFDTILRNLLPKDGDDTIGRVYFQPEQNTAMIYPAIVYERENSRTQYASNLPYRISKRYTVTVIVEDPDSDIPDKVAALPMSSHNRFFVSGKLNHDVFVVYF